MSKVLGIIAEYNPFHNGHLYHLEESKKKTNSEYSIAVISGNFTQRGSTSIINKWEKTKIALDNGIDLVIELPTLYATSSAESFAEGAVKILNSLKIVDYLSFGAETSDIDILNKIATILYQEPEDYKKLLSEELTLGISFPKAREKALINYLKNDISDLQNIISSPNNILAIEYIKSLQKLKSNISPIAIKRKDSNHNDLEIKNNIASGTAIRNLINNNDIINLKNLVPNSTYITIIKNLKSGNVVYDLECFQKEIIYNFRKMPIEEIRNLPDVSEGLEFSIKNAANSCNTLDNFIKNVKTKRYTFSRIQRICLYSLLNITKKDIALSKTINPYIRVLGFNENGKNIISKISNSNSELKIITSVKKFMDNNLDNDLKTILEKDIFASNIYTLAYNSNSKSNLDYTTNVIKK